MRILHVLLELILVFVTILFTLELKEKLLEKFLAQESITYKSIRFITFSCIEANDLRYNKKHLLSKALICIDYLPLLHKKIRLSKVFIHRLDLNSIEQLAKHKRTDKKSQNFKFDFLAKQLRVDAIYRYQGSNTINLEAQNISLNHATIKKLLIKSFAGTTKASGIYQNKKLTLKGELFPKRDYISKLLPTIDPGSIQKIRYKIGIESEKIGYIAKTKANTPIKDLFIELVSKGSYVYDTKLFTSSNEARGVYKNSKFRSNFDLRWRQKLFVSGKAHIINDPYPIPLKHQAYQTIDLDFNATDQNATIYAFSKALQATIDTDYKKIHILTSKAKLGSLFDLPKEFQDRSIQIDALYDNELLATIKSDLGKAEIEFFQDRLNAQLDLQDFKEVKLSKLNPLLLHADLSKKQASLQSPLLKAKLHFQDRVLARIFFGGAKFLIKEKKGYQIDGSIPSAKKFLDSLTTIYPLATPPLDLGLKVSLQIDPKSKELRYDIRTTTRPKTKLIPLQKITFFEMQGGARDSTIFIDYYALVYANRGFFATKRSKIAFDSSTIKLDPFWIEDSIRISGEYKNDRGNFEAIAKNYHYSSIEGTLTLDGSIDLNIQKKKIFAEGSMLLKDGVLTFEPRRSKEIEDPDIIVVDAPKKEKNTFFKEKISLNIKIDATKPIIYKIPDLKLSFKPDLLIWKEFGKDLELLGYINILKGLYNPLGEEYFIQKSKVYFYSKPTDPILELHVKTKKDQYTIYITVSGSLTNPILSFDSDPYLPQKDLLPLLLIGSSSYSLLMKATGGSQLLNAFSNIFLKNMLQSIGIHLDTLALTSRGDRIGFEIGKKITDKITVIYKNDAVSTIVIRYIINDHIESEVIFGPDRSGINLFYRTVR